MTSHTKRQIYTVSALFLAFAGLTLSADVWRITMSRLFPSLDKVLYDMAPFTQLATEHGVLVLVSSGLATVLGLAAGIAVTRSWGREMVTSYGA